jgi:3-hydroxybutyryl-CoA dehydrogenase
MQVLVLSNELQKEELLSTGQNEGTDLIWVNDFHDFENYKEADAVVDLLFENLQDRISFLKQLAPSIVIINSVTDTLAETDPGFIRIAGWQTFLRAAVVEASCLNDGSKKIAEEVFGSFNKNIHWLPDEPGFVTPRVISTIINEAYFALAESVSTPEEIDTAMKLGTAYPYGPFEWSREIGLQNISTLLHRLSTHQKRYTPSELLVQETDRSI